MRSRRRRGKGERRVERRKSETFAVGFATYRDVGIVAETSPKANQVIQTSKERKRRPWAFKPAVYQVTEFSSYNLDSNWIKRGAGGSWFEENVGGRKIRGGGRGGGKDGGGGEGEVERKVLFKKEIILARRLATHLWRRPWE